MSLRASYYPSFVLLKVNYWELHKKQPARLRVVREGLALSSSSAPEQTAVGGKHFQKQVFFVSGQVSARTGNYKALRITSLSFKKCIVRGIYKILDAFCGHSVDILYVT